MSLFAPSRVLVTGAAGFVGRHMLAALRDRFPAARVIAAIRPADAAGAPLPFAGIETRDFDLRDPAGMAALVAGIRPDACVHLAALADVGASFAEPDAVWAANVDGTRALASALVAHAPGCVLLHAGSAEIYGLSFQSGTPLDEHAPLRPANPYAAAKAAIDVALGEMALRGLHVLRMRPLNHIGAGQSPSFAVAAFARQVARIEAGLQPPALQTGALDRARDFLDVRDVCAAYVAGIALAPALPPGTAFNLASGRLRSMAEVVADLLALAGVAARLTPQSSLLRPTDIASTCCNAAAARSQLAWAPAWAWHDTLRSVLDDWRRRVAEEKPARHPESVAVIGHSPTPQPPTSTPAFNATTGSRE